MRKSTLLISAALTTFVLAILAGGVVSAYRGAVTETATVAVTQPPAEEFVEIVPVPVQPQVTPEEAAALAAQVLGRTDLYSVETADLNGVTAYMVTFSSSDVVYVSLEGQILSVTNLPPVVTAGFPGGGGGNGGSRSSSGEQEDHEDDHEEREEHEEHEDEDD